MNYLKSTKANRNDSIQLVLCCLIALMLGAALSFGVATLIFTSDIETVTTTKSEIFFVAEVQEIEPKPIEPLEEPSMDYLGNYRITAYCACEKCCGKWANNRPDGIVIGAAGIELKSGISVASPLPFGTTLYIDGYGEYVVQDRTASWIAEKYNNEVVDIYFDSHEEACEFGLQYLNVYTIESEDNYK